MAGTIYVLCSLVALGCAVLLLRSYRRSGLRLLLWSGICFSCLALNNALVFVDLIVVPQTDLFLMRNLLATSGMAFLTYGLIWDSGR
ncbi:MAG TPA: DUF5985 family protein [Vicinamibacteria bacterium]|nr:DUF5985 family protein [Vicinamibacteria bacterium]